MSTTISLDGSSLTLPTANNTSWDRPLNATISSIVTRLNLTAKVFNVLSYGATGDGTTDDTSAIQAALNAAEAAGGGTVFLPKGTYQISTALKLPSGVVLQGAGRATWLRAAANISIVTNKTVTGDTRSTIRDLVLYGNKATYTTSRGLKGLFFVLTVENCWITQCGQEGVYVESTSTTWTLVDTQIDNCDTGIRDDGDGLRVVGASSEYNTTVNYDLRGKAGVILGYSEGNLSIPTYGFHLKGAVAYTIAGCKCSSEASQVFRLTGGANNNRILGNWISNSTATLIYADSSTYDNTFDAQYVADHTISGILDLGRNLRLDRLSPRSVDGQRVAWGPLPRGSAAVDRLLTYRSFDEGNDFTSVSNASVSFINYRTENWRGDALRGLRYLRTTPSAANGYAYRALASPSTDIDLVVRAKQLPLYSGGANDGRVSVYDVTGAAALLGASNRYTNSAIINDIFLPVYIPAGVTSAQVRLDCGQTNDANRVTEWGEVEVFQSKVKNGSFESTFSSGVGTGWTLSAGTGTQETTTVHQGSNSQKVVCNSGAKLTQALTLTDGRLYRFRAAIYVSAGSVSVGLGAMTAFDDHAQLATVTSDSTGGWRIVEETFYKQSGTNSTLTFKAGANGTTYYLDSVAVWEVESANTLQGPSLVDGTLKVGLGGTAISKYLSNTKTWDPASMNDGTTQTTTVNVTGAALGDVAFGSFSLSLQGILMTAYVSTTDTVTVVLQNETGGTLDLGSGTLRASVIQH